MVDYFLGAYESVSVLTDAERTALPRFMAARWLQMRIRGMRKIPLEKRLEFLDRGDIFKVLNTLHGMKL